MSPNYTFVLGYLVNESTVYLPVFLHAISYSITLVTFKTYDSDFTTLNYCKNRCLNLLNIMEMKTIKMTMYGWGWGKTL